MKHVGRTLLTVGTTIIIIGLVGMLLNFLDFYNLPDNCPPHEFNCGVLLDKWRQDREERFLLTVAGVLVYLAGWLASRLHKKRAIAASE